MLLSSYVGFNFVEESYNDFLLRYSGFGEDFYQLLKEQLPDVFKQLRFFKSTNHQPEDSFALYQNVDGLFCIQLDPLCEVVILWNNEKHVEFNSRCNDQHLGALMVIKENLL
ncbi:hypothetical protein [Runella sp.]|uniref:hypothetical protein n=1 Tax=Runella sp. TaxID=1960881 RepID=UPI003D0B3198